MITIYNQSNKRCWLYDGCPCRTAGCWGTPDEGCPVYRYFKQLIEEREKEQIKS